MQLTERIHLVASGGEGFGLTHHSDCHTYLIDGGSEALLIDAGAGVDPEPMLERITATGAADRLRHVLITHAHADHAGGAASVREALGVAIAASAPVADIVRSGDEVRASVDVGKAQGTYAAEYRYKPVEVTTELADGERLTVGEVEVEVVDVPGHAIGHLAFLVRDGERTDLFTGDTLLFGGRIILQDTWDCDLRAHLATIRRLGELRFDGLFPGHRTLTLRDGERHVALARAAVDRGAVPPTLL